MNTLSRTTVLASFWAVGAVASPALAAPTDGVCDPLEAQAGLCFVSPEGFVVEAVTGPNGEFPVIDDWGNSVFAYLITGPGVAGGSCQGTRDISHAALLIPAACAGAPLESVSSLPPAGLQTGGQGDPACGFGAGDLVNDVLKWDQGVACDGSALFSVTVAGVVPATPTSFSIKAGPNCSVATILGPACGNVVRYCPGNTNSTGGSGSIDFDGSFSIAENNFWLLGSGLPPENPGFFFFGTEQIDVPFGDGRRCIGGTVGRLRKVAISVNGTTAVHMDLTVPPLDTIVPGVPYYFQLYYRDLAGGGEGFNTTDALAILFTP